MFFLKLLNAVLLSIVIVKALPNVKVSKSHVLFTKRGHLTNNPKFMLAKFVLPNELYFSTTTKMRLIFEKKRVSLVGD